MRGWKQTIPSGVTAHNNKIDLNNIFQIIKKVKNSKKKTEKNEAEK